LLSALKPSAQQQQLLTETRTHRLPRHAASRRHHHDHDDGHDWRRRRVRLVAGHPPAQGRSSSSRDDGGGAQVLLQLASGLAEAVLSHGVHMQPPLPHAPAAPPASQGPQSMDDFEGQLMAAT